MIAAGVGAKHLQTYLGHSSITTTLDIYGHLMPGSEEEAAGLLDAYLAIERKRAEATARGLAPTSLAG
jgi:integrase